MTRARLPNRRASESVAFVYRGKPWVVSFSRFHDGRFAELFLSAPRAGTDEAHGAIDAAVVVSIALQAGADIATIRDALIRDPDGGAAGPLGRAIDAITDNYSGSA